MAVARVACRAQVGLQAPLVQVEISLGAGLPTFCIVGLPAPAVKESKERVRAALLNSRFEFPAGRITVNLAPADLPKEGGRFDLPIALGILLASGQIRPGSHALREGLDTREFYGELGLSGELKPVRGLLLAAAHAQRLGHELVVPRDNAAEACAAAPTRVRAASHLLEVCAHLSGKTPLPAWAPRDDGADKESAPALAAASPDLNDVRGQLLPKRAILIAAAGGHSLLMIGPPGSGKSMLAQRLPGLLPPLTRAEALEVAAIAAVSAAGFAPESLGLRPFRAPHHTASTAALVGGGARARPGEISLAHHGVLFLDELPEFGRTVLEALREPLETGTVAVSRAAVQSQYPAAFQLIAAMNPCACGRRGDPAGGCTCTPAEVRRYLGRISGPLLDRMDMHVEVPRLTPEEFDAAAASGESTRWAAERVARARRAQLLRQGRCNARLSDVEMQRCCAVDEAARRVLDATVRRSALSGRARARLLRLARTIADLEGVTRIDAAHLAEAAALRRLDRDASAPSAPCDRRLA